MMFSTALLALVAGASAHTLMSEVYINGEAQGSGTCIRMPSKAEGAVDPIEDLTSTNMACGKDGEKGVARVCGVDGGATLTFEFREWPDDVSKGPFDIGHKGPCAVYLKKVGNAITDSGNGDGWFKIWEEGYDESASKWCTEKVIDNSGRLSVNMPETLQGGYYLVRSELLALHNANLSPPDPQFYVGCTQVFLQSSGSVVPDPADTVSIPGYVNIDNASVTYDIYAQPLALPYPIPGPSVYKSGSMGVSNVVSTVSKQTEGLKPANCIATNANWCGTELENYSTEDACWVQSAACWKQTHSCYDTAPPTGATGCQLMEDKCNNVDSQCNNGNFNGPPDAGKVLDPSVAPVSLPAAVNTGVSYAAATKVAVSSSAAPSEAVSSASAKAASSEVASSAPAAETSSEVEAEAAYSAPSILTSSAPASTTPVAAESTEAESSAPATVAESSSALPTTFSTSAVQASLPVVTASAYDTEAAPVGDEDIETVTASECEIVTVDVTVYATATPVPVVNRRDANKHMHRRSRY